MCQEVVEKRILEYLKDKWAVSLSDMGRELKISPRYLHKILNRMQIDKKLIISENIIDHEHRFRNKPSFQGWQICDCGYIRPEKET